MVLDELPTAKIVDDLPWSDSGSKLASMTEVDSIADVIAGGSSVFFVDYDVGVLFLYESGGDAIPTGFSTAGTITYYSYESLATSSANHVQLLGDVKVGDFVTFDSGSNYIKWTPDIGTAFGGANGAAFAADPEYDTEGTNSVISAQLEAAMIEAKGSVVAQVLGFVDHPQGGMEKVMTHFTQLSAYDRMPGTATGGMTDNLVHAGGANRVAVLNFMSR
jgi:hypothetical protein